MSINLTFDSKALGSGKGNYETFVEMDSGDSITVYPPNGWSIMGAKLYTGAETGGNSNDGGSFTPDPQKATDVASLRGNSGSYTTIFQNNPGFSASSFSINVTNAGTADNSATITDNLATGSLAAYEYLIWIQKAAGATTTNDFIDPGIRNR